MIVTQQGAVDRQSTLLWVGCRSSQAKVTQCASLRVQEPRLNQRLVGKLGVDRCESAFEDALFERTERKDPTISTEGYQAPTLARTEWEHIQRVLTDCGGNVSEAARRLGIHRRSLQRKLQKFAPQ